MISLKTESGSKAIILYMLYVVVCVCVWGGFCYAKGSGELPQGPHELRSPFSWGREELEPPTAGLAVERD